MKETITNSENVSKNEEVLKGISNFAKTIKVGSTSNIDALEMDEESGEITSSKFKVCTNTLPEKTSAWTKVKNVLCYKIEVKLTPYEQKIENEINDFLYQEITWEKVKDFFMQDIDVTFRGKKLF